MSDEVTELTGARAKEFADTLRKVRTDPKNWTIEYEDPSNGDRWLMDYPNSTGHGGGSPRLRKIGASAGRP